MITQFGPGDRRKNKKYKKEAKKKSNEWKDKKINSAKGLDKPKRGFNLFQKSCSIDGCRIEFNTPGREQKGKDPIFSWKKRGKNNIQDIPSIKHEKNKERDKELKKYLKENEGTPLSLKEGFKLHWESLQASMELGKKGLQQGKIKEIAPLQDNPDDYPGSNNSESEFGGFLNINFSRKTRTPREKTDKTKKQNF